MTMEGNLDYSFNLGSAHYCQFLIATSDRPNVKVSYIAKIMRSIKDKSMFDDNIMKIAFDRDDIMESAKDVIRAHPDTFGIPCTGGRNCSNCDTYKPFKRIFDAVVIKV
jgi:hypothetical protein